MTGIAMVNEAEPGYLRAECRPNRSDWTTLPASTTSNSAACPKDRHTMRRPCAQTGEQHKRSRPGGCPNGDRHLRVAVAMRHLGQWMPALRRSVSLTFFVLAGAPDVGHGQAADRPTGFPAVCAPTEVQVMVLGTYHFANPGRDVIKQDFDDVLEPRRQIELTDLVTRLAQWQPDRIAVEQPWSRTDSLLARFARYRAGTLAPNRNEVVQIGY